GSYSWTVPNTPSTNCLVKICDAEDSSPCDQSDAVFTITPEAVTVTAPNGGENWCVDTTYNITWTYSCIDNVQIEYSTNGGSTWMTIIASTPSVGGSYAWTVPNTPSSNCLVRICDAADNNPCDLSDNFFTIEPCLPDTCIYPEHFVFTDSTSDSYSIVIDSAFLDGLELEECDEIGVFDDTGGGKGLLCVGASVYHPADLPIPLIAWKDDPLTPQKDGYTAGDTMYFRVWSKNQDREEEACAYYLEGDGHFESGFFSQLWLEAPCGPPPPESITVTSPNGGEDWCAGSAQSITWTSVDIDTVEIEYSTDGGSSWITVVDKTPAGPGSYSWTVPNTPSTNCLVKICDAEDNTPCDQSDAVFTISPEAVTVTAPNGRENWCAGDDRNITWTSSCVDSVKIEYSTDGGSTWMIVVGKTPAGPGSYSWTVPNTPSTNCLVKICDAEDSSPCDQSDTVFTIGTCAFYIEAHPDTQKVVVGDSTTYQVMIFSLPDFWAPCTLSIESGLPTGATYSFDPNPISEQNISILTIFTSASTPAEIYELTIRGIINPEQETTTTVVLIVQDFTISAAPDIQYVTPGQAVGYEVMLTSLFEFDEPCTLFVSGLPDPPDSGIFDQATLIPTDTTTLNVYTSVDTDTGWYTLSITAQRMPGTKLDGLQHSVEVMLRVEEPGDAGDWEDNPNTPKSFALFQNQPNPFNPETKISYYLPRACQVRLTIYNVLGQKVKTLFDDYQDAGMQTLIWDGRGDDGVQLSSGIYFYRLQADNFHQTKKMTLMK
ncbi:MAG: T9SS type A sorting domain-containing protein, partial [candidate division Zixibacteria bacterium]|nr:T9SS type A sorting domain-containing protein [candidate division Zixibacteria bacterium]